MKQKFSIFKNEKEQKLVIQEFGELDKDMLSFLCEETYDSNVITAEITRGKKALVSAFRTHNLFPNIKYADAIADAIMGIYESSGDQSIELFFDDLDMLSKRQKPLIIDDDLDSESAELDDLLEDDAPDPDFDDEDEVEKVLQPTKIIDDDPDDTEDED